MLFQLKKLPEIINLTRFLKSFWMLYIDQIIVYNAFYSKSTFYIIKDRCQMHTLKVFRSPVWLLLHKLSSPHYHYIRKMRRGDRLPLTQTTHKSRRLSPIRCGFTPGFVNYKKGAFDSQPQVIKVSSCLPWSVVLSGYPGFFQSH